MAINDFTQKMMNIAQGISLSMGLLAVYYGFIELIRYDYVMSFVDLFFFLYVIGYGLSIYSHFEYIKFYNILMELNKNPLNKMIDSSTSHRELVHIDLIILGKLHCFLYEKGKTIAKLQFYTKWGLIFACVSGFSFFLFLFAK